MKKDASTDVTLNDLIERCALLDGITPQELLRYCPTAKTYAFRHGGTIYSQGTRCNFLFFVINGQVKLARVNRDGRELMTALMVDGDFSVLIWVIPACQRLRKRQPLSVQMKQLLPWMQ